MNDIHGVGRKKWTDGKKRLENCLNSFVRALVSAAAILERRRREAAEHSRRWKEQQEQWAREEQARKDLAARVTRLDKQLASWQTARDIRAFVEEARGLFSDGAGPPTPETDDYLNWALRQADELDPFRDLQARAREAKSTDQPSPTTDMQSDSRVQNPNDIADDDRDAQDCDLASSP